jgi:hypothetical protein
MATWLKQSTAVDIKMGPFLDSTDGNTQETALTITQPDIRLAKNGGAWAQKNASQTLSHEEAGWYEVALDTTDTNTLGILIVAIHESGALPVWREFMVVPANIYDSVVSGSDVLDVSVTQWLGTAAATPTTAGVPEVDVTFWLGTAAATPSVAGVPEVDVTHWIGTAAATPTTAGVPEVDVTHWLGTAAATPTTAGVPEVDLTHIAGAAVNTSTAQLGVNVVSAAANSLTASALATDAVTEIVNAVLTTQMTEAYSTDGSAPTLAQAVMLVLQRLYDFSISGTTITVKKLDGSTTAATITLNDANTPTSSTRSG